MLLLQVFIKEISPEQRKEINASKRDLRNGNFISQSELDEEVAKWAKE